MAYITEVIILVKTHFGAKKKNLRVGVILMSLNPKMIAFCVIPYFCFKKVLRIFKVFSLCVNFNGAVFLSMSFIFLCERRRSLSQGAF